MDVEADLAVLEGAVADAVQLVADDAIGGPGDGAVPLEVDRLVAMTGVEPHPAAVHARLDDQVGDDRRDGVPGRVPDRDVHPLDQLDPGDAHVAQVDAIERHPQRTRLRG